MKNGVMWYINLTPETIHVSGIDIPSETEAGFQIHLIRTRKSNQRFHIYHISAGDPVGYEKDLFHKKRTGSILDRRMLFSGGVLSELQDRWVSRTLVFLSEVSEEWLVNNWSSKSRYLLVHFDKVTGKILPNLQEGYLDEFEDPEEVKD
jgi:hypothetical protein